MVENIMPCNLFNLIVSRMIKQGNDRVRVKNVNKTNNSNSLVSSLIGS